MSDYGENKKQICFDSTAKLHADLKIRLHHDEVKIREFFNEITRAYVNRDESIINFIEKLKEKKKMSATRRNKIKKANKKQNEIIRKFALDKGDIENIFDIIEKEHPNL
jgi:glycerol-3-phosphate responsive antiterminator